jgi:recombination protein RecA
MRKLTWLVAKRRVLLVFTNQLRQNLNAMAFGDKWIEPCGKATSFHSSVKIRFETIEKLKNSVKDVIGVSTRSTVRKNRMGPPFRQAEFDIYFASGIADYASWIETAVKRGILTGPKNNLAYNGEKFNVQSFVKRLNEDSEFKDKFYNEIVTSCILTYESPNQTVVDKDSVITDKNVDATDVIEAEE